MLSKILVGLAILVAILLVIAALQPAEFRISRSATVSAPASVVFPEINDFRNWQKWSPYEKLDPAMKRTLGTQTAGAGASYAWSGNSAVGEGSMTLVESQPNERLLIRLDFLKPMAATNLAEFTLKPQGGATVVTWSMTGKRNLMLKVVCLFMNMDRMVGGQFEEGLVNLNTLVGSRK